MTHALYEPPYESLFVEALSCHIRALDERARPSWREKQWCAFWGCLGTRFWPGGLMIVGRCLNGSNARTFTYSGVRTDQGQAELLAKCRESSDPVDGAPLHWLENCWDKEAGEYRPTRSAFLRMAHRLAALKGHLGSDWPSWLCWSNLARISPATAGNTPWWSYEAQLDAIAQLLSLEIERAKPGAVVVLAGWWFDSVASRMARNLGDQFSLEWAAGCSQVLHHGRVFGARLVVAQHPQRRPERVMVGEIQRYIA